MASLARVSPAVGGRRGADHEGRQVEALYILLSGHIAMSGRSWGRPAQDHGMSATTTGMLPYSRRGSAHLAIWLPRSARWFLPFPVTICKVMARECYEITSTSSSTDARSRAHFHFERPA